MSLPGEGGTSGEIAEGVLPELLRTMYVGRRSGMRHLIRGDEEQSLRFRGGHIVNAHTNIVADRLGEMLVRRGLLTPTDLARATEVVVREKRRLGEVLAELGLMDRAGLEDAIALHVHEMLAKVFAWQEGTYSFEDEAGAGPGQEVTLKLSTGELILEAVRAVQDPDVVRYALGDIDRVLTLSSDPLLRFQTSGTWWRMRLAAVPDMGEYVKACPPANSISCTNARDSSNAASVSPGKPAITSVVMAASGTASRAAVTNALKEAGVVFRAIRFRVDAQPLWRGM